MEICVFFIGVGGGGCPYHPTTLIISVSLGHERQRSPVVSVPLGHDLDGRSLVISVTLGFGHHRVDERRPLVVPVALVIAIAFIITISFGHRLRLLILFLVTVVVISLLLRLLMGQFDCWASLIRRVLLAGQLAFKLIEVAGKEQIFSLIVELV